MQQKHPNILETLIKTHCFDLRIVSFNPYMTLCELDLV